MVDSLTEALHALEVPGVGLPLEAEPETKNPSLLPNRTKGQSVQIAMRPALGVLIAHKRIGKPAVLAQQRIET
jgi:hypothetical protein